MIQNILNLLGKYILEIIGICVLIYTLYQGYKWYKRKNNDPKTDEKSSIREEEK